MHTRDAPFATQGAVRVRSLTSPWLSQGNCVRSCRARQILLNKPPLRNVILGREGPTAEVINRQTGGLLDDAGAVSAQNQQAAANALRFYISRPWLSFSRASARAR